MSPTDWENLEEVKMDDPHDKQRNYMLNEYERIIEAGGSYSGNAGFLAGQLVDIQGSLCKCASRKCSPHRCWPSLVGWITISALAVILWYVVGDAYFKHEGQLVQKWEVMYNQKFIDLENKTENNLSRSTDMLKKIEVIMQESSSRLKFLKWSIETSPQEVAYALSNRIDSLLAAVSNTSIRLEEIEKRTQLENPNRKLGFK